MLSQHRRKIQFVDLKLWNTKLLYCMLHDVFVYGTLKRNEPNHNWLTDPNNGIGKFIGEAKTKEKYPLIIATRYNIPFLLYGPGKGNNVKGEIYEVDDQMLSKLDELEGHPEYYVREQEDVVKTNSKPLETVRCWIYFLKNFKPKLLDETFYEDYSSEGSHGLPYQTSELDEESSSYMDDLMKK